MVIVGCMTRRLKRREHVHKETKIRRNGGNAATGWIGS